VKTIAAVFNDSSSIGAWDNTWTYAGTAVPVQKEFVYLGIMLKATGSLSSPAAEYRISKARKSLYAMRCRAAALCIRDPQILSDLFNSVVRSTLEYEVEICGVESLCRPTETGDTGNQDCNQFNLAFLKQLLGVRPTTPGALVLAELGLKILWVRWHLLTTRYWGLAFEAVML
jgi:hypothetical protein